MISIKFTPVLPKKFNATALIAETTRAMKFMQNEVHKDFLKTTDTWENKPEFENTFEATPTQIRFEVSTDDEIYGYVNNGTRPHEIEGFPLAFMAAYKSKTTPRKIGSHGGGGSGETVFATKVHHPGTEPRDFDTAIVVKEAPRMSEMLRKAVKKARVDSGHAI